jgi:hypothetical protein
MQKPAMLDRAIGILGLAIGILSVATQYIFPKLPSWVPLWGYAIGILLVGFSLGLISAGGIRHKRIIAKTALLRLHVFGDHRTPDRLACENIFRWYYLQMAVHGVSTSGVARIGSFTTLFISFENDVLISTIRVRSPDMQLPVYEVKEFNQRYAIIVFSDNIPAGTLEVSVSN